MMAPQLQRFSSRFAIAAYGLLWLITAGISAQRNGVLCSFLRSSNSGD
jgi:hypothetical protein